MRPLLAVAIAVCVLAQLGSKAVAVEADAEMRRMLALNMYHEARSEGREGMVAIGWIVLNRVADGKYPKTILGVIKQRKPGHRCEWGWWCDGRSDKPRNAEIWALAQQVASDVLSVSPPPDPTDGALWFHHVNRPKPKWMRDQVRRTVKIRRHYFYARN